MSFPCIKSGDIIGFSGRCPRSDFINLVTGGIPRWGISHVGIIGQSGYHHFLFDSAKRPRVCGISGTFQRGVQARLPKNAFADYDGRIWHYPLYRRLFKHESRRLSVFLNGSLGNEYDPLGAIRSAGFFFARLNSLIYGQDLDEKFCSELCAAAEARIGILPLINASFWNPNKLLRTMRRAGLLCRPVRVK